MKRALTFICALLLCGAISAQQKTYYVSPSGDDGASGLSAGSGSFT